MQRWQISPGPLQGVIQVPPSKSHTLRAILFAALAKGASTIHHPLYSPDTEAMIKACHSLGAQISLIDDRLEIEGIGGKVIGASDVIQAGNSGIVARFIAGVAALGTHPIVITGDHSIRYRRPFASLLSALQELGVDAISTKEDGHAPVIIQGPLRGGLAHMDGGDSQPVSALLIAAALCPEPIELVISNPKEQPFVEMTLQWLQQMEVDVTHRNYECYWIKGGRILKPFEMTIPGDFSSAAFPLAAALVTRSEMTLTGLNPNDFQGDQEVISHLQKMGARIDWKGDQLHVTKGTLQGAKIDVNGCIDALPILAVLGCFATGKTTLFNGAIARHKESDRISTISNELGKMGAEITEKEDGLVVHSSQLIGAEVIGHADHRIAMALSVAALGAKGNSSILGTECVAKTYPSFVEDFQSLGAEIQQ